MTASAVNPRIFVCHLFRDLGDFAKEITSREQMTHEHYYAAVSVVAQHTQECQNEGRQTNFIALTAKIKGGQNQGFYGVLETGNYLPQGGLFTLKLFSHLFNTGPHFGC